MRTVLSPQRIGDDVFEFEVETAEAAQALAASLGRHALAEDVVPGLDRVAVRFDPSNDRQVLDWLSGEHDVPPLQPSAAEILDVPIAYGGKAGPDLAFVCDALSLSKAAFISLHTQSIHRVEMIGFTPGFAYISGLSEDTQIPRLKDPRPRVAAGSVGISSAYTGIYALAGPGGWPLIGQTNLDLFLAEREPAFLLTPGQRIRFKAV